MKAIEKERQRRYFSAAHLADDIRRHINNEPVEAGPPSLLYRSQKFFRRHRGPVAAVMSVVLVLALGLLGTIWFAIAADTNARHVSESLTQVLRLSDVKKLTDLETEAMNFSPYSHEPGTIRNLVKTWFEKLDKLTAHLGQHRDRLLELKEAVGRAPSDAINAEEAWQLSVLEELVLKLEAIQGPKVSGGSITHARQRMARLRTLVNANSGDPWRRAIESIQDKEQCPMYEGLVIKPQFGVMPIGRNEISGLWEFVDLLSGEAPERGMVAVHKLPELMNVAGVPNQVQVRYVSGLVVTEDTGIVYVLVPGGTFAMGSPESERGSRSNEDQQIVTLSHFLISKYEVTQAQWKAVMAENPSRFSGGTLPVENISWNDARDFCKKTASALPEAAQWEYACRGGTTGPYGLEDSPSHPTTVLDELAWFTLDKQQAPLATNPVGGKRPNAFGLFDMHGNVWEWCEDVYTDPGMMLQVEASRPTSSAGERVIRGGYYGSRAEKCRCSYFEGSHVTDRFNRGLRPFRPLRP